MRFLKWYLRGFFTPLFEFAVGAFASALIFLAAIALAANQSDPDWLWLWVFIPTITAPICAHGYWRGHREEVE
jgi:hypothetical protein